MIRPIRDKTNGYRMFDQQEMQRVHMVAQLRHQDVPFDAIRTLLDDAPESNPGAPAGEEWITARSRLCSAATAAVWNYACRYAAESGTSPGALC